MPGKQGVVAVLIGMCILSTSALAQVEKNDLTVMIGRIFISDQRILGATYPNPFVTSGGGLSFELNYARRLFESPLFALSAEVPAVFNLDENLGSGADVVPSSYRQIFVTPAVRLNFFPETAVTPWASFGGGFGHFTEGNNLNYYGTNPGGPSTSGVIQAGVGLDVSPFGKALGRFSLRGEFRDFWSGTPDLPLADTGKTHQHNHFVAGGVIWHF